ncbi:flagellar hook-associated protein 3 FlgL [Methylophilus rhizosphaerae]|uniref:Flagellar hook-associated protein 3 FlgL n=1 Tax=Methylophilus rhizosphaerae TaxID=492660 RepID=A0A1G8ZC70_9PROT|nr:flagellar hook-associated protein FlgL [Methylophilus rhizosphaerae]SDK12543.1 flagellar hook-associated protein 3 FlgL [Methylophilus rhizosphaerae]
MRISTNTIYQSGTNRLMDLQNDLSKLQEQISSGKKVRSPADDPVAAARVLELTNAQNMNNTYTETRKVAKTSLETYESSLTSITNVIQDIQSSLVNAGNGSYTNDQRQIIANELQTRLDTLVGLSNTKDSQGNYMYSGYQTETAPFDTSTGSVVFQGDSSKRALQVDVRRQMQVTYTGDQVFQANGNDLFATLQDTINLLNTPITDDASQQAFSSGLADSITKMQGSLNQVLSVRADLGSKLNELDTLDTTGSDMDLQYQTSISNLQDLDYTEALSDLAKKSTILEAAQKSYVQTSQLSLFSFL